MADEKFRFTAWLSANEREGITKLAHENGTSANYIVRVAIRELLGLPTAGHLSRPPAEPTRAH